jgi:hypothetical protein
MTPVDFVITVPTVDADPTKLIGAGVDGIMIYIQVNLRYFFKCRKESILPHRLRGRHRSPISDLMQ